MLLIAIMLNNALGGAGQNRRVEYHQILEMVRNGEIKAVAMRGTSLVGVKATGSRVQERDFPENDYDFETTIGSDEQFIEDAKGIIAAATGKDAETLTAADLGFKIQYRAPVTRSWLLDFIPYLVMMGVVVMIWYFMMRSQMGGGSKVMNFSRSNARMQDPEKNKVTFADVAGADEEKEELEEMVDFLRNPSTYTSLGAKIPKGVLLVGPPGTGKTLLAKAVAGEAGVPFFSISGSDFVEMFVGVGASRVRDLFEQAKKNAPSIVFIDEIDAVGRHRGAGLGGGHDEREQTLNQLLVEMDGFDVNEGVIVMAATNRRDILDPALLRPGRFDRQVTVNYPDQEGRVAILKVHSKNKPLAADVDLDNIAKRMPYSTGAELANVINEGAILAARSKSKDINQKTLIEAIDRVQMGPEKKSHKVNPKDQHMVAVHESGHAVVGHFLSGCDEVHLVTIMPRGQSGGHTLALPAEEHDSMSRSQMLDMICMMLGGHAAEEVILGEVYTGSSSDLKRATEFCRRMVTQYGMSEALGTIYLGSDQEVFVGMEFGQSREYSENVAAQIDAEVKKMLDACYDRAKAIIAEHRDELNALVETLKREMTVSRSEFLALMSGKPLEREEPVSIEATIEELGGEETAAAEDSEFEKNSDEG
ncbi:MAG: ATP-dependent zinc metalloprotease FtsH [Clostridia bacterium]|nr:ATP-dependent zinc metalloprotease FtsH [Clostridia bacterium]